MQGYRRRSPFQRPRGAGTAEREACDFIVHHATATADRQGPDGWKNLSYAQLADAYDQGLVLQSSFAHINTDGREPAPFRKSGGENDHVHGLSDVLIMPQGSINYYERVIHEVDGLHEVQKFLSLLPRPGNGARFSNGTTNPNANPPFGVANADGVADGHSSTTR